MFKYLCVLFLGLVSVGSTHAQECLTPTKKFAEELKTFLTEGADFEKMAAVKSQSHKKMYYVAVYLEVPGASGWALFASNTIEGFGQMYAVDDIANDFSTLLDGRRTKGAFSTRDPAAKRARYCLDQL